jgi:hypothetical protein
MCRTGGPRCNGSHKATSTADTTSTSTELTSIERSLAKAVAASGKVETGSGSVPTRECTDELAAKLGADRTGWDGQPLDDKGRRLYALRESGYTGWIDQDGYPVATSEGAATPRHMAEQRGETNIAGGSDQVAVQVGQVGPDAGPPPVVPPVSPAQPGDEPSGSGGGAVYVVSDNARVGMQADDVIGDVRFSM